MSTVYRLVENIEIPEGWRKLTDRESYQYGDMVYLGNNCWETIDDETAPQIDALKCVIRKVEENE